jgi:hypothetical protein
VHRLLDFLPLILAVLLIIGYLAFNQPLPFLSQPEQPQPALQPVVGATPTVRIPTRAVATQPAACRFGGGIAELKQALGEVMGDPTECEHATDAEGNTQQKTTRGLAYYRKAANISAFTNGYEHWALTPDGVVTWAGDAVEPPADAQPLAR